MGLVTSKNHLYKTNQPMAPPEKETLNKELNSQLVFHTDIKKPYLISHTYLFFKYTTR